MVTHDDGNGNRNGDRRERLERARSHADAGNGDERDLVERARSDADAFAELYRRYLPRVHAYAFRRTGSREVAEDLTSATFERALRSLDRFQWRPGGFGPWLFRIAANELVDHQRRIGRSRSARAQRAAAVLSHAPDASVDDRAVAAVDADLVAAIGRLNPRYQRALGLRYLAGLDPAGAARAMGVSKPTMAVIVHRATAALRRVLDEDTER